MFSFKKFIATAVLAIVILVQAQPGGRALANALE